MPVQSNVKEYTNIVDENVVALYSVSPVQDSSWFVQWGSMQRTTTYILLFSLAAVYSCPTQLGTLLCLHRNGSISVEMGAHCCHGHSDHKSQHTEKEQHIPSDKDCFSDVHTRCCMDVPLSHAGLDATKPNVLKNSDPGATRVMTRTPFALPNPLQSRFRPYSTRLYAHSPPADTIVLLI
jgi:hypothetical protein